MKKRLLSLLLAATMIVGNVSALGTPLVAAAEESAALSDPAFLDEGSEYADGEIQTMSTTAPISFNGTFYYSKAYEILELTNQARAEVGAEPLTMDADLLDAAMQRAGEIAFFFDHKRPDGTDCYTASAKMFGENIAGYSSSSADTMEQWMNSAGHRENIERTNFTTIGIGCFQIGSRYFWVQCFGMRNANPVSTLPADTDVTVTTNVTAGDNDVYLCASNGGSLPEVKTMQPNTTYTVVPYVTNRDAPRVSIPINPDTYIWTSSNENVATVDDYGTITAVADGTAAITCTTKDGSGDFASCNISVSTPVTTVNISQTEGTIPVGSSLKLSASVLPTTASNQGINWTSSNPTVATVDSNGNVSALSTGNTTITATAADNSLITAACNITVIIPVTGLTLAQHELSINTGNTAQLSATIKPDTASQKTVNWTSSNPAIASVNASGQVTALANGTTTITAASAENANFKDTCTVTVTTLPASITLNQTSADLHVDDTLQLTAAVAPDTTSNKAVEWTTSNPDVATVSSSGKVSVLSAGTAVITATSKAKNTVTAACTITATVPVTSISMDKTSADMYTETTLTLNATISPDNASQKNVIWSSSDPTVASVSYFGTVKALTNGTTTITAMSYENHAITTTCKITVKTKPASITLNQTKADLHVNDTLQLTATVNPDTASNKEVEWTTSNPDIATVNSTGKVTIHSAGRVNITATSKENPKATATCFITATVAVTSVSLDHSSLDMNIGSTRFLTATVSPDDASNKNVNWTSSDPTVASVDSNGIVSALNNGTTTITVSSKENSEITDTCEVTVTTPPTRVTLNQTSANLHVNDTLQLTAAVAPDDASNKAVDWTSSNPDVATVSSAGKVTVLSAGTAVITATSKANPKLTATCTITATVPATSVSLDRHTAAMDTGTTLTLTATVKPDNASQKKVNWTSSDPSIASVDSNGKVTALANGTTTITASSEENANLKDTCAVTVTTRATGVTLNKTSANLVTDETVQLTATVTPRTASDKRVVWTSSNNSIATVDSNGYVTAHSSGTAVITATSAADNKITASCTIHVAYIISYELNGGTNNSTNPGHYFDEEITLAAPSRAGYLFDGWYTDSDFTNKVTLIPAGSGKDLTLYANWKKVEAATTQISAMAVTADSNMTVTFGNAKNADGYEIQYSSSADFPKEDTISYRTLEEGAASPIDETTSSVVISGVDTAAINTTKKLYVRIRACQKDSVNEMIYGEFSDSISGNTIQYQLNDNFDNADGSGSTIGTAVNNSANIISCFNAEVTLKDPTWSGHTFEGWYTDSELTEKVTRIPANSESDHILYAKWIDLTLAKPSVTTLSNPLNSRLTVSFPSVTDADGYRIQYSTDSIFSESNTQIYDTSAEAVTNAANTGDITVTLRGLADNKAYYVRICAYRKNSDGLIMSGEYGEAQAGYTIRYMLDGGTNNTNNILKYYNTAVSLKNPKKAGYIFKGWYTNSTYTSRIASIPKGTAKKYVLYAKWEKAAVAREAISSIINPISSTMRVTYKKISGAVGYQVTYSTNSTFSAATTKTLNTTSISPSLTGLKSNTTYYVKVRAYTKDSCGTVIYGSYSTTLKGYSIKYVLNNGKNNTSNVIRYYNTTVKLKNPTRAGYTFAGWYTNKTFTTRITSIAKGKKVNYTLYAKWRKN